MQTYIVNGKESQIELELRVGVTIESSIKKKITSLFQFLCENFDNIEFYPFET